MAVAKKPRKKKPSVTPAVKEYREAIREQKVLANEANKAINTCVEMLDYFDKEIEPVKDVFTIKETEDYNNIRDRALKDIETFKGELDRVTEDVKQGIEETYKGNKINEDKKLELFGKVIGYGEVTENVVNYIANTESLLTQFTEEFNAARAEEKEETKDAE